MKKNDGEKKLNIVQEPKETNKCMGQCVQIRTHTCTCTPSARRLVLFKHTALGFFGISLFLAAHHICTGNCFVFFSGAPAVRGWEPFHSSVAPLRCLIQARNRDMYQLELSCQSFSLTRRLELLFWHIVSGDGCTGIAFQPYVLRWDRNVGLIPDKY